LRVTESVTYPTPPGGARAGVRAALPLVLPTLALGLSFGIAARPVIGSPAAIAMSALVCAGGAQFAALSVLSAGGGIAAAALAGVLMNTRWVPMSFALTPSLGGGRRRRMLHAQAIIDASFVIAGRGDGTFDGARLVGATLTQASAWIAGTVAGALGGGLIPHPDRFGFDAVFPAFYLCLLVEELRTHPGRRALVVTGLAGAIALLLMPVAPPGIPVVAASAAALAGRVRAR
jgi:predicted branched-subunit amino acid permease